MWEFSWKMSVSPDVGGGEVFSDVKMGVYLCNRVGWNEGVQLGEGICNMVAEVVEWEDVPLLLLVGVVSWEGVYVGLRGTRY